MFLIGITGGIGAGKSVVSRLLRAKGYEVYDCDSRAKELMAQSEVLKGDMVQRWGEDVLLPDGSINRPRLAEIIFSNDSDRDWLNGCVHSLVRRDIVDWLNKGFVYRSARLFFVESAILHTSKLDELCSDIWVVDAPEELRLQRAMSRGGIKKDDLLARNRTQSRELASLPPDRVSVISNAPSDSLIEQVDGLLMKILNLIKSR